MKFLSYMMRSLVAVIIVAGSSSVNAEERLYGSFIYNSDIPNALFFIDQIKNGDDFELRKALRNHNIDTIVLASRGGSVWAGLSMAGIIFDKNLRVYVPPKGICASACSFMFFGGNERLSEGKLGVHQFASSDPSKTENAVKTQAQSQFTVSEIIGFLNEFDTPRFVLERMFEDREMYWFNEDETSLLNSKEFTLEPAIKSVVSKYASKKLKDSEVNEAAKPTYSEKELIALIQKRLNEIGCSAGVADGIWGRRTNSAAVRFAKISKLPTSTEELISEQFVDALAAAKKGACPKSKAVKGHKFANSYFVSCEGGRTETLENIGHYNGTRSVYLKNASGGLKGLYKENTIKFVDSDNQMKDGKYIYIGQATLYRRNSGLVYKMVGTGTVSDCKQFTISAR
jgi:peptidoglycan hydrolase-like protein with peptidoglycan-binding domain